MDNTQNTGNPDKERINVHEEYEVQYWAKKFGISHEQLKDAVREAGTSAKDVEEHLNNKR